MNSPNSEISDGELAIASRDGDAAAFAHLMRRHNQRLFRVARGVVPSDEDAMDALQEGYVKAFASFSGLQHPDRVVGWLARIIRNEALMIRRSRWREEVAGPEVVQQVADGEAWMTTFPRSPELQASDRELRGVIERAVDKLPDEFREVFILRAIEGMTHHEIGAVLGIPVATAKTRYFRARFALRSGIEREARGLAHLAFTFGAEHCDRVVESVLARITQAASGG